MATLSTAQKDLIQQLIDLQVKTSAYEKPIGDKIAHDLSTLHSQFGYVSQLQYLDDLRDAPFSTLLKSLLAVAA